MFGNIRSFDIIIIFIFNFCLFSICTLPFFTGSWVALQFVCDFLFFNSTTICEFFFWDYNENILRLFLFLFWMVVFRAFKLTK